MSRFNFIFLLIAVFSAMAQAYSNPYSEQESERNDRKIEEKLENLERVSNEMLNFMNKFKQDEQKRTEKIEQLYSHISWVKTSLLADMCSGFGKLNDKFENLGQNGKNNTIDESLGEKLDRLRRNLTEAVTIEIQSVQSVVTAKMEGHELKSQECCRNLLTKIEELISNPQKPHETTTAVMTEAPLSTEHATENNTIFETTTINPQGNTTATDNPECQELRRLNLTSAGNNHYLIDKDKLSNWQGAKRFCERIGMQLAIFRTRDEMNAVWRLSPYRGGPGSLWVGASDIGQRPGQFYWTDGLRVPDNFWGRNPDDFGSGKKTCACLSNNSANLNDQSCDIPWPFVCQVDQQHRHCV